MPKTPIPTETDTLFSKGRLYTFLVRDTVNQRDIRYVKADTQGHACDYITRTRWISRTNLRATIVRE